MLIAIVVNELGQGPSIHQLFVAFGASTLNEVVSRCLAWMTLAPLQDLVLYVGFIWWESSSYTAGLPHTKLKYSTEGDVWE